MWGKTVLAALVLGGAAGAVSCGGSGQAPSWVAPGVYRGTLGQQEVTLELRHESGALVGAYFYARRATNLALNLSHRGEALVAGEEVWGGPDRGFQTTGCLTLNRAGTGLRGEWTSPDGKRRLPVSLAPLDVSRLPLNLPDSPGLQRLRAEDPLAFLKLNRPWRRSPDGVGVREPLSGVTYPRMPGGSPALNAALQDRQLVHAANALDCRSQLGDAVMDDGYTLSARVTFRSPHLVSVLEMANYYCGGAHPDAFDVGLILDRQTGREVAVRTIWPELTSATQKRLYFARARLEPDCRAALREPPSELEFTAHLTAAGLALTPKGLPHVIQACAETVTLPYTSLRRYADPQGRFLHDLYR